MTGVYHQFKGPVQLAPDHNSDRGSAPDLGLWDVQYVKRTTLSALGSYNLTIPDCHLVEFRVNVESRYIIPTSGPVDETVLKIGFGGDKIKYGFAHISAIGSYDITVSAPNLVNVSGKTLVVVLSAKSTGVSTPQASLYTKLLAKPD